MYNKSILQLTYYANLFYNIFDNLSFKFRISGLLLYPHKACARAFKSIHPDPAAFNLDPIVLGSLFSLARDDQIALANHSGESSVNGFISPVMCHIAEIVADPLRFILLVPDQNALAHISPVAKNVISNVPTPYITHKVCPVAVMVTSHIPLADTTSDNTHTITVVAETSQDIFIPLTAFHNPSSRLSENPFRYPAVRGSIHPEEYHTGNPH